jgi:hypothetical protein
VAATLLAGLMACGALLAALGGPVTDTLAAPASGSVMYPGGAGCATTLQACIDNSPTGTTILTHPNTYFTNGLTLSKAVSLTGVSSATVILHALANQRVLTVTGAAVDSSVIISGLTFAGGHAVGSNCPAGCGGAILITATAQPLLINLAITNSRAEHFGSGLFANTGSPLVMAGVAVLSNTAAGGCGVSAGGDFTLSAALLQNNQCTGLSFSGGGLFAGGNLTVTNTHFLSNTSIFEGGGAYANANVTLNGGSFQNNRCTASFCLGAGLFAGADLAMSGTRFLSNTRTDDGGGTLVDGNVTLNGGVFQNNRCTGVGCSGAALLAGINLAATNTQFLSNTSNGDGGGAYVNQTVTLNEDVFQNNQCTGAFCQGGGLVAGTDLAVTNTLFLGNTAQQGAGLYHFSGSGRLVNDLFAANSALSGHGDALLLASPGAVSLLFTTIASPTVGGGSAVYVTSGTVGVTDTLIASCSVGIENAGGNVREDYNLFSGLGTSVSGTVTSGGHSHPGAANFVDPAAGDYHLGLGSAAIDAGVDAGINLDIDGDPRPLGNGIDIGYDEANIRHLFLPLVRR